MVYIVEHLDSSNDDLPVREGVALSMSCVPHRPELGASVHVAQHHTPVQASRASSWASLSGSLSVARELLRNPQALWHCQGLRQWRDNVDHVLSLA